MLFSPFTSFHVLILSEIQYTAKSSVHDPISCCIVYCYLYPVEPLVVHKAHVIKIKLLINHAPWRQNHSLNIHDLFLDFDMILIYKNINGKSQILLKFIGFFNTLYLCDQHVVFYYVFYILMVEYIQFRDHSLNIVFDT